MPPNGKSDKELWKALENLDDDLLDLGLPEALVEGELRAMGIDPAALAKRGSEFVAKAKDEDRLSWQVRAQERRSQLQARASKVASSVSDRLDRKAMLARLDELRASDPEGGAIRLAARKRKPEESTDDELRALLEEMEALRAIEDHEPE